MSRKFVLGKKGQKEPLMLPCEWMECGETFDDTVLFLDHITEHIQQAQSDSHVEGGIGFDSCLWAECDYNTQRGEDDLIRHIFFHGFHVKLKSRGMNMIVKAGLSHCQMDGQSRNLIPELPEPLSCGWRCCGAVYQNPEYFYQHCENHALNLDPGCKVKCEWEGCTSEQKHKFKLKDHLKSHTQEKAVACPECGGLFSNRTKFHDHLRRQTESAAECYICSHCNKKFPTERLLRDHMRHHVNQYKCPYCDMTCPNPSSVQHHIKYRHSSDRAYNCNQCNKSFKSSNDLRKHLDTHSEGPIFRCHIQECDYETRYYQGISSHFRSVHQGLDPAKYVCHVCGMMFIQGHSLTKHLRKRHKFKWPSGHRRFRYKQHEDGFFRLQMVRYESVTLSTDVGKPPIEQIQEEETPEVLEGRDIQADVNAQQNNLGDVSFTCNLEMLGEVALHESYQEPARTSEENMPQPSTSSGQSLTSTPKKKRKQNHPRKSPSKRCRTSSPEIVITPEPVSTFQSIHPDGNTMAELMALFPSPLKERGYQTLAQVTEGVPFSLSPFKDQTYQQLAPVTHTIQQPFPVYTSNGPIDGTVTIDDIQQQASSMGIKLL